MKFLLLLIIPVLAFAQNIPSDQVKIGRPQTSDDKELIFDTNDGVSNKKLSVEKTTKKLKWDGNSVQIGDGAATDKEIIINGTAGKALKYDSASSQFEFNDDLGINGFGLKTNTIIPFSGTETSIEQDGRVKGSLKIGTATNEIRVQSGNLEFSNDGLVYKKIGSGSGGGDGGVNLAANPSFEDGAGNWTATGGTYSVQPYANPSEGELNYARYISSGASQTLCSDAIIVPDFLNGGCVAYSQYKTTDNNAFELQVLSASAVVNKQVLPTTNGNWLQTPPVALLCPAAGQNIQVCYNSLSAATIEVDKVYKGSENRTVQTQCQGIAACETEFSATISDTGVVSGENLDWINGNAVTGTQTFNITFNAGIFTVAPNCAFAGNAGGGANQYHAIDSVTSTGLQYTSIRNGLAILLGARIVCQKAGADFAAAKPQTAVTNSQSGWFIDASIGGGNPDLGSTSISSYTEITNATLDLVLNSGSASAQIPCSATNPPTGLTCAAGNESVGVVFTPPYSGYFDVCGYFNHQLNTGTPSGINSLLAFQWVETGPNNQTIIQQGKTVTVGGVGYAGQPQAQIATLPHSNCGTFLFSDTSPKTIRLMREQNFPNQIFTNIIGADRAAATGQRDIRVTVRPSTMNIARPVLTGDAVTSKGVLNPVIYSCGIINAGSPTFDTASGMCDKWLSSVTIGTLGFTTLNIIPNVFSLPPVCVATSVSTTDDVRVETATLSAISLQTTNPAGSVSNGNYNIICHGVK